MKRVKTGLLGTVNEVRRFDLKFGGLSVELLNKAVVGKLIPQALYGAVLLDLDHRVWWESLESACFKALLGLPASTMVQSLRLE